MNRPTIGDSLPKMGSRWIRTSFESKQAQFTGIPWFQPRECQEGYIPSADVIAAMESCGSIDWAVKNKHITDDMALKIRSALKPLESHETTVSDNNMNASIPVNPFITRARRNPI